MFQVIQSSSKLFDNDIIEYNIGLSDHNSGPNTEKLLSGRADKCKTQLGIEHCDMFWLLLKKLLVTK